MIRTALMLASAALDFAVFAEAGTTWHLASTAAQGLASWRARSGIG